jgi:hypothetical protein
MLGRGVRFKFISPSSLLSSSCSRHRVAGGGVTEDGESDGVGVGGMGGVRGECWVSLHEGSTCSVPEAHEAISSSQGKDYDGT